MSRILAIDYGRKRTGLAMTDPLQMIASGLETVETHKIWEYIDALFKKEAFESVVVGYPKKMDNTPSEAIGLINTFVKKLNEKYPDKKIHLFDERFTSKMAFQAMIDGGLKKEARKDKAMVDKISAVIILQSFMEMKNNGF
jgi:putative holliday junction resolvase